MLSEYGQSVGDAIKSSLKKLELQGDFSEIAGFLENNDIEILPLTFQHMQSLLQLPLHHNDPFDRLIIAQALVESLTILSKDSAFEQYNVVVISS